MAPVPGETKQHEQGGSVVATRPGLYTIRLDDRHIIRIDHLSVQRLEDIDDYLGALTEVIGRVRSDYVRVRLLADLRHSPVRTQEIAERLRKGNEALYRSGDRVALLVESSLLKIQLRRNLVEEYQNIFMSPDAAEKWLTAYD